MFFCVGHATCLLLGVWLSVCVLWRVCLSVNTRALFHKRRGTQSSCVRPDLHTRSLHPLSSVSSLRLLHSIHSGSSGCKFHFSMSAFMEFYAHDDNPCILMFGARVMCTVYLLFVYSWVMISVNACSTSSHMHCLRDKVPLSVLLLVKKRSRFSKIYGAYQAWRSLGSSDLWLLIQRQK